MDADAEKVMQVIEEFAGVLPFTDKSSPEVIKREIDVYKRQEQIKSEHAKRIEKEMQYNHSFSDWCIGSGRTYTDTNV